MNVSDEFTGEPKTSENLHFCAQQLEHDVKQKKIQAGLFSGNIYDPCI